MVRIGAISLGLGLGTAFAAELTITPAPSAVADESLSDPRFATPGWRYLDPGFLVDHLPFKLTIGQSISYSDNVANLPRNISTVVGANTITRLPSRGDFYSDTTISLASRFPMGAQTFFFNGVYAPRRYFTDTAINADSYSINGGVDFNVANRCSGQLVAGLDEHQTQFEETVGFGTQDVSSVSFNERGRCIITGHVAALANSGVSRIENTGGGTSVGGVLSSSLNNYNQQYIAGGLEYSLTSLDTLRGLVTFTHRDFTNRSAVSGLATATDQEDYQVLYSRIFSPKLDGSATAGVSVFTNAGSPSSPLEPTYSFQLNYRPSPKFVAAAIVSRGVGAPQSAISNVQISNTQSLSLTYIYSPKLSITGVASHITSQNPGAQNVTLPSVLVFTNSETENASLVANYRVTPLLTATAAYSYVNRTDTSRSGFDAVSNVFRVGLVYTR